MAVADGDREITKLATQRASQCRLYIERQKNGLSRRHSGNPECRRPLGLECLGRLEQHHEQLYSKALDALLIRLL